MLLSLKIIIPLAQQKVNRKKIINSGDVFGYRTSYRTVSLILLSVALIGAVAILMNGVLTASKRYKDAELTQDRVGSAL